MFIFVKKNNFKVDILYHKIISLDRNKFLYQDLKISDTFYSRIILIFFHISFLLIRLKNKNSQHKDVSQKLFDYMFLEIEKNMRELGLGDTDVNKKMKELIKIFYNILLQCESFNLLKYKQKGDFIKIYIYQNKQVETKSIRKLLDYFDKYRLFSINLSSRIISIIRSIRSILTGSPIHVLNI